MFTPWLQNGAVLLDDGGRVILCDACPCGAGVTVPCCPNPIPKTLYLTFHDCTGTNACLNGVTVPLVYSGTNWLVSPYDVPGCGAPTHHPTFSGIVLEPCDISGQWQIAFTGWTDVGITGAFHPTNTTTNCDPIQIDGNWSDGAGNAAAWTITE